MAVNLFQAGGVDSNWGTVGNWTQAAVPTASDGHVTTFDGTSPACTVNTSSRVANTLDFTGYTGTITMSQQITVSGSITLASGMTIAGTGALLVNATATLTSNGKTWPNALTLSGTITYTLADNWDVDGVITLGVGTVTTTVNGFQIAAGAGVTHSGTCTITGTTLLLMNGTGSITFVSGSVLKLSLTINTSGTVTFSSQFKYNTGTLTYIAGTIITTGMTLEIQAPTATFACAGITWNAVQIQNTTLTLTENLVVAGLLTFGVTTASTIVNGNQITASGGLTHVGSTSAISGTTAILLNGTGTITGPTSTGTFSLPLTINTAGTITLATANPVRCGGITYVAGTVVTTGSTLAIGSTGTIAISGVTWNAVTIHNTATVTLSENLTVPGLCTIGSGATVTTINGNTITCTGGLRYAASANSAGTTAFAITATQTLDSTSTGTLTNPVALNAPGGTITVSSAFRCDIGKLSVVAGAIIAGNTWPSGGVAVPTSVIGIDGVHIAA